MKIRIILFLLGAPFVVAVFTIYFALLTVAFIPSLIFGRGLVRRMWYAILLRVAGRTA